MKYSLIITIILLFTNFNLFSQSQKLVNQIESDKKEMANAGRALIYEGGGYTNSEELLIAEMYNFYSKYDYYVIVYLDLERCLARCYPQLYFKDKRNGNGNYVQLSNKQNDYFVRGGAKIPGQDRYGSLAYFTTAKEKTYTYMLLYRFNK